MTGLLVESVARERPGVELPGRQVMARDGESPVTVPPEGIYNDHA